MIITEDKVNGTFTARIHIGEWITWKARLDYKDKPGIKIEYFSEGEQIIWNWISPKWWWAFNSNQLERELEEFINEGMDKATKKRTALAEANKLGQRAKNLFQDE